MVNEDVQYLDYISLKSTAFILDLNMPKMSSLDVINELSNDTNFDSKKNIIVISGSMPFRSQINNPKKIKWIFQKPINYDRLSEEIREIQDEEIVKPQLENKLDDLLDDLYIKPYTKGAKYLKNAIKIAYYDNERDINITNITKQIANGRQISNSDSIQSAMDKTVNTIYIKKIKNSYVRELFAYDDKITTKDFINRSLKYIDNN